MINLGNIFRALTGIRHRGSNPTITESIIDSRKAIPGSLFIALKGEKTDGHHFIEDAFAKGSRLALIEDDLSSKFRVLNLRDQRETPLKSIPETPFCILVNDSLKALQDIARWWRHQLQLRVIGITGSVGKTSTKEIVTEVLRQKYRTYKNPGNYNNEIGLPLTILNIGSGYERLVLEMGFYYPGEIRFLCGIAEPEIGVVTNVGTVHAERAGSQQVIADGKAELVECLPESPDGTAILNFDDPFVKEMEEKTAARVIYYGLNPEADVWADEIKGKGLQGIEFRMHYKTKSVKMTVPLIGRHSVQTILRASATGFAEDLTWDEITEGLLSSNSQLRLVSVRTRSGAVILDDTYNATPESTIAALNLLDELRGQKIAVLGDMLELGRYEAAGHKEVGQKAAEVVNHLIAVGQRGRIIAETALEEGLPATAVTWVKDASDAADLLKYNLKEGDIVLIKGSHGLRMDRISAELEEAA